MSQLPEIPSQELKESFLDAYFECLEIDINGEKRFLQACDELYFSYMERIRRVESKNDKSKYINETDWLKNSLYQLLEEEFPEKREILFEEEFGGFIQRADSFLMELESEVSTEQAKERFYSTKDDSALLVLGKFFKRNLFHLSRIPQKTTNLFKKEKKTIRYWKHRIPLKSMIEQYFINRLVEENLYAFEELMQAKCKHLNINWEVIKNINAIITNFLNNEEEPASEMIQKLESLEKNDTIAASQKFLDESLEKWRIKGKETFAELEEEFRAAMEKVGTMELGRSHYSLSQLRSGRQKYLVNYKRIFGGWKNSIFAQLDDIQIDIELYHIKYFGLMQYFLLTNSAQSRIERTIVENFQQIEKHFDALLQTIKKEDSNAIHQLIVQEKEKIAYELENKIIPRTVEAIYEQDFPNLIDRMEFKISKAVDRMKEERLIYAKNEYDSPIRKSELSQFNPRELVQVSILKDFREELGKLKSEIVEQLGELQAELSELSGIIEYNLESALNSEDDEQENNGTEIPANIKEIACEGIERTKAKTKNIAKNLIKLQTTIEDQLKAAVEKLSVGLVKLTNNDNITELRIKLAAAKAANRTISIRDRIFGFLRFNIPPLIERVKKAIKSFLKELDQYWEAIGLKAKPKELTAELSEFLVNTDEAIAKLPYVYKRLYRVAPLTEEIFFEGRVEELDRINKAYERWQKGSFEATLVTGEKGSGTSSLINFFLEKAGNPNTLRHKFNKAYSSKEDFLEIFREILNEKRIKSQEDVVDALKAAKHKVVVFEDAQHLYLKKIGGFDAIQQLFDLISETSEEIFWVIEVTTYTYNYLQKTIRISSYFKNHIRLEKVNDEQMVNLIMRRHRVSGYNLEFGMNRPSRKDITKMRKLDPEGRQEYLKEKYFKRLNDFAGSNISLALLYWLRSTTEVKNNTIYIGMLGDMKFEFLSGMNEDSIFTLHALLLHDSLNVKEHAILFHQSEWQSKMILMVLEDNGILNLKEDRYSINRLLYRQVVNVLQQKNILH
jgi:hypothetical protein